MSFDAIQLERVRKMPVHSARQYGKMQAIAHGNARGMGPSPNVAREMINKTSPKRRSQYAGQIAKKRKRL